MGVFDYPYPIRYMRLFLCSQRRRNRRYELVVAESERFHVLNGIAAEISPVWNTSQIRKNIYFRFNLFLIGHGRRFTFAKIIHFYLMFLWRPSDWTWYVKLVLIGKGELGMMSGEGLAIYSLNHLLFLSVKYKNVFDYLQAMDTFVFPSVFEGLRNRWLKHKPLGLPCIVSTKIFKKKTETSVRSGAHTLNTTMEQMYGQMYETTWHRTKNTFLIAKDAG